MKTIPEDLYQKAAAELVVAWSAQQPSMPGLEIWLGMGHDGKDRLFFRMEDTKFAVGLDLQSVTVVASGEADQARLLGHYLRGWESWMADHMHEPVERVVRS